MAEESRSRVETRRSGEAVRLSWEDLQQKAQAGREAFEEGRYEDAETHLTEALWMMQAEIDYMDPALAEVVHDLAKVFCAQRKYARGKGFYRRLIAMKEQTLGPDHPEVAAIRTNLAMIRDTKDRLVET